MKKLKYIISGIMISCVIIVASGFFIAYGEVKLEEGKICNGVYIDSVFLGGMTKQEAEEAVSSYVEEMSQRKVTIKVSGESVNADLTDFDFSCKQNEYIEQALNIGKTGNIVKRYNELKTAEYETIKFNLNFKLNEKKVANFMKEHMGKFTKRAKSATVKRANQQFVYTNSKVGKKVDTSETIQKLKMEILESKEIGDIEIEAVIAEEMPKYSKEDVSRCKDEIGTYATNYSTGAISRSKNLENAASLIDTSVVYPGEVFSVYNAISPLDESNGYYPAPSYANGEVVDSLGGGVCQVSTTLFNAVIRAELEIIERSPHSMVVSYVSPSMDAAIAGTYKDLKFKNNTDTPIYIMGGARGGEIYFKIFGHETRSSGRKIKFESEILQTIQPGADRVTNDPSKPPSYMAVTQQSHIGYKAKLWKIITEKGKTKKVQMNTSTYAASPRYIVRGTAKVEKDEDDKTKATSKPDSSAKPKTTPKPRTTKKPRVTKAPNSDDV